MAHLATAREKAKIQNSLLCLLKGLERQIVTVELRNETSVRGRILNVDMYMNTSMTDAEYTSLDGSRTTFSSFYVQGRNIRFVQIPDHLDMTVIVQRQLGAYKGNMRKNRQENWIGRQKKKAAIKRRAEKVISLLQKNYDGGAPMRSSPVKTSRQPLITDYQSTDSKTKHSSTSGLRKPDRHDTGTKLK